jgi:hypothetical protein
MRSATRSSLVDFGPRPPGSGSNEQARGYITKELEAIGWKVTRLSFDDDSSGAARRRS